MASSGLVRLPPSFLVANTAIQFGVGMKQRYSIACGEPFPNIVVGWTNEFDEDVRRVWCSRQSWIPV